MINKCCSSTISVQNGLKIPVKDTFYIKIKFIDNIDLFKQKNNKNEIIYFPIQKSLKILPKISSTLTLPTIMPRCLVANRRSSAALSKSTA